MKEIWAFNDTLQNIPGVDRVVSRSMGVVEGKGERLRLVKGDSLVGSDASSAVLELEVKSAEDEETAIKAVEMGFRKILVKTSDWKVIPWENLVAKLKGRTMIIAEVSTIEEAKLALRALELGVDGVALNMPPSEASKAAESLRPIEAVLKLREAVVEKVSEAGMGLRACIDTCDVMSPGEGMLIGSFSSLFTLVEAEVLESGFTKPRPFRVNAGAISQYIMGINGATPYLSDLRSGDSVLAVSKSGEARPLTICRMKVEKRPLRMVEVRLNENSGKVFLQDAETIRIVTPDGSISVRDLKPGDRVIAYAPKKVGRHFGTPVEGELMLEF
ncbi:MAG: 3-dehydroquinate synthase II [Thermoproteota archaeon]